MQIVDSSLSLHSSSVFHTYSSLRINSFQRLGFSYQAKAPRKMSFLVARTGRHQQRYEHGYRLLAGCIPYRYRLNDISDGCNKQLLEVLMITSHSGDSLLFPKGGWEMDETVEEAACREPLEEAGVRGILQESLGSWDFKSKRQQSDCSADGLCRAHMFALAVTEQLDSWPEQHARQRKWFAVSEAIELCHHEWMRGALHRCISYLSRLSTPVVESGKLSEALPD